MKIHLASWWERLRASYWAVPAVMALGACLLAEKTSTPGMRERHARVLEALRAASQ